MADCASYTQIPHLDPDAVDKTNVAEAEDDVTHTSVQVVNETEQKDTSQPSVVYPPRIRHCSSEGNLSRPFANPHPEHVTPLLLSKTSDKGGHVHLANSAGSFRWLHRINPSICEEIKFRQELLSKHPYPSSLLPIYRAQSNLSNSPLGGSQGLYSSTHWDNKSNLSQSTSGFLNICRICHMPQTEREKLISPCRCSGSLKFIHYSCLQKWIDICSKKSRRSPKCELCHYQYTRHKRFKFKEWRFPHVSQQDKILHSIFLVMLLLMIACAIATVSCFISDRDQAGSRNKENDGRNSKAELTTEEIVTLACGVLFFISFFVAMTVQIKARHTVYQLFVKLILHNMEWEIDPYDKSKDSLYAERDADATSCRIMGHTCL